MQSRDLKPQEKRLVEPSGATVFDGEHPVHDGQSTVSTSMQLREIPMSRGSWFARQYSVHACNYHQGGDRDQEKFVAASVSEQTRAVPPRASSAIHSLTLMATGCEPPVAILASGIILPASRIPRPCYESPPRFLPIALLMVFQAGFGEDAAPTFGKDLASFQGQGIDDLSLLHQ